MTLDRLYYFHVTARYENITRAAAELYISQPALSKAIKSLENELETELFYKKGKHIYLTEFGKYLKSETDKMFTIWQNIDREVKKLQQENMNSLRLNVLAATSIVTDAVVEFKRQNSEAIFHIIQNEEVNCDISVTTNSLNMSGFKKSAVFEEKIYLAVPKSAEYEDIDEISLIKVKDKGFVNLSGSRLFRTVCDKFCEEAGFKPNIIFESDSPITVKNIIKTGAGIGFWPEFSWSEFPNEDINLIKISKPECQRQLIVGLHSNSFMSPVAEEFYQFLTKYIEKHISSH